MNDIKKSLFYEEDWRWSKFLKFIISKLSTYNCSEKDFPLKYIFRESKYGPKKSRNNVQLYNWIVHNSRINLARAVCINSPSYSVLNFLIIPNTLYNIPFFGVDFVTLPNLHLLVLDFQPSLPLDRQFDENLLMQIMNLKNTCHQVVPRAEKLSSELDRFFSPGMVWSKLSRSSKNEKLIEGQIYESFTEYFNLYLKILYESIEVTNDLQNEINLGQKSYLEYRKEKDPARPMLTNLFGKEFTEELINNVLFLSQ